MGKFSHLVLCVLGANMDIQVTLDIASISAYLMKYITKGETRSGVIVHLFSLNVSTSRNPSFSRTISYLNQTLFNRDISTSEAAFILIPGTKIWSSSFHFIKPFLQGDAIFKRNAQGKVIPQKNIIYFFAKHHLLNRTEISLEIFLSGIEIFNLHDFVLF